MCIYVYFRGVSIVDVFLSGLHPPIHQAQQPAYAPQQQASYAAAQQGAMDDDEEEDEESDEEDDSDDEDMPVARAGAGGRPRAAEADDDKDVCHTYWTNKCPNGNKM